MHNYLNLDDIDDSELIIDSGDNGHNGHNGYNEETQVIPVPGSGSAVSRRKKEKDKNKVTSKAGCNTVSKSKKNEKKMEHETTP
jgi:hypothetical protein